MGTASLCIGGLNCLNFYEHNHPKYFHVCHQLLSAISGAVSPRLQHSLTWNRTVNPNGGPGKNLEMDLQMEFFNKEYKDTCINLQLPILLLL